VRGNYPEKDAKREAYGQNKPPAKGGATQTLEARRSLEDGVMELKGGWMSNGQYCKSRSGSNRGGKRERKEKGGEKLT